MSIKGVSTRDVEAVMAEFGVVCLSSSQVSRAAKLLDEELAARAATARSARSRISSSTRGMRRCAMAAFVRENSHRTVFCILLTARRRRALGHRHRPGRAPPCAGRVGGPVGGRGPLARSSGKQSTGLFSDPPQSRKPRRPRLRGVDFIVSDDHSGLRAARRAVLGGATWQRCQFHLARNAIHHAPSAETAGRIGRQLKSIWTAEDLAKAETALAELVASYRDTASKLADWLEQNVPEGLAVFTLPEHHRKRLRTSNPIERSVQQELKRRTVKVRVFPSEDALLRLVSAVLVEIDEKWASETTAYLKWECQDA